MAREIYRIGQDIYNKATGQKISYSDWMANWNGKPDVVESTAPEQIDHTAHDEALINHPEVQNMANGGSTAEEIINALETGNWSNISDINGQPFSAEQQNAAYEQAQNDNEKYYKQLQEKDTADAEASLAKDQADYQDYLINAGQAFEADKSRYDQQSANQGVLFSGSRVQKEKNLERAYEQDQAVKQRNMASNIGNTARDFQYNYGNEAAGGLSQYYNIGGNSFNANKARNNVGSSGISSVYNSNQYKFDGRMNTERSANSNTRAANYLKNRGNKLLSSGYTNQL